MTQLPFEIVGTLTIGENNIQSAGIDLNNGFAYFGCSQIPGSIAKIRLSDFTQVASLSLNTGENTPSACCIDTTNGFIYFGIYELPSKIIKIRLSDFTRVAELDISTFINNPISAQIDTIRGFAYFGAGDGSHNILKINLSDFTIVGNINIPNDNMPRALSIDTINQFLYAGVDRSDANGTITKINIPTLDTTSIILGEFNSHRTSVIDVNNGYVYFGGRNASFDLCAIWKIRMSDLANVDTITVPAGGVVASSIDTIRGFAYFILQSSPHMIYRVSLSDFTFANINIIPSSPSGYINSSVIDTNNGFMYFGSTDSPAMVYKVKIGEPVLGALTISSTPPGAIIFIDGIRQQTDSIDTVTPATITGLTGGPHDITISLTGFNDYIITGFNVVSGTTTIIPNAILIPNEGCIYFTTNPPGASIYIDDDIIPRGITPLVICGLSLGPHTYRLVLDGYTTIAGTINLTTGEGINISVDLTPCTPTWQCEQPLNCYESDGCGNRRYNSACCPTGDVCIKSNPSGALISIDGILRIGKITVLSDTPCTSDSTITGLSPGTDNHTYEITLPNYQPATGTFSVTTGQATTIDIGNLQLQVVQEGFGGLGILLLAGLGLGLLFASRKKEQ